MDEKYDLKWKTFNEHMVGVFKDLGEKGHFADVTLVSDDQVQTKAHTAFGSAAFKDLFSLGRQTRLGMSFGRRSIHYFTTVESG